MLKQSYNMQTSKHVAVQNSPSYRQCRPASVSSKQDSGRAGPEKSVLYKHKSRIYLICSYRAIICYLLNMQLRRNPPSYRQCRPAPVSSKQDSGRTGPVKSVLYKHKVGLANMLMQSYKMLSIKHVAVQNSPSYRQCRPALVSSKQDSSGAGPVKSVLYKHKVGFN